MKSTWNSKYDPFRIPIMALGAAGTFIMPWFLPHDGTPLMGWHYALIASWAFVLYPAAVVCVIWIIVENLRK